MSKITITIEASTMEEVYTMMKLKVAEMQPVAEPKLNDKFKLSPRKNKTWTEFEINFLTENYMAKNVPWIAGKLMREKRGVYQMLSKLYKKGLTKKNNLVKTL